MPELRSSYHTRLAELTGHLLQLAEQVHRQLTLATQALLDVDVVPAEETIATDRTVDAMRTASEDELVLTLAREAPVAAELRRLTAGLRIASDLERMGDLAVHVAKVARRRFPDPAVPPPFVPLLSQMSRVADAMLAEAAAALRDFDAVRAARLADDDDQMDALHRQLLQHVLAGDWPHGITAAVDLTLLARYYERFADHAVSIGRQVHYAATGKAVRD